MNRKMVRFGENIKILRNKNGLTQEQLANAICVTRQTISAWEKKLSYPDVNILAKINEIFGISMDELIFGKIADINANIIMQDNFCEENVIGSIKKKGFYDILKEDIQKFFPIIEIRFARVMGIVMELNKRGYHIVSVYSNGFSVYFLTDEAAEKFPGELYDIIDTFIHFEAEKTVVLYSEQVQERIDEIEINVLREIHKAIFGAEIEDMFYWIDDYDRIRGYGATEEECKQQARQQKCLEYTIMHE